MGSGRYVCSCGYGRPVTLTDIGSGGFGSGVSVVSYSDIEAVEGRGCAGCGRTGNVYAQDNAAGRVRYRRRRFMRGVVVLVVLFVAGWLVYELLLQQGSEVVSPPGELAGELLGQLDEGEPVPESGVVGQG